ncbi:hypothetical protein BCR44DRAFT_1423564, partial [Catenaria anguillulae PL171]
RRRALAARAPHLTSLVRNGASGTLRLSDPPRDVNNASNELSQLLSLDVTPRREFAKAFQSIHPGLDLAVITPSPDAHLLASDVSLNTTLLSASSLSPDRLAHVTKRALANHPALLVHLPYFTPGSLAARGNYWTTPVRIAPELELAMGGRRPPEHEPAPSATTNADEYVALVDGLLAQLIPEADAQSWLVAVVASWDQAHLPEAEVEAAMDVYRQLNVEKADALRAANADGDDDEQERQAKHFCNSAMRSLPLSVVYAHSDASHVDGIAQFEVFSMYRDGGYKSVGAWHFLRSLVAKMNKSTGTSPIHQHKFVAPVGQEQQQQQQQNPGVVA